MLRIQDACVEWLYLLLPLIARIKVRPLFVPHKVSTIHNTPLWCPIKWVAHGQISWSWKHLVTWFPCVPLLLTLLTKFSDPLRNALNPFRTPDITFIEPLTGNLSRTNAGPQLRTQRLQNPLIKEYPL